MPESPRDPLLRRDCEGGEVTALLVFAWGLLMMAAGFLGGFCVGRLFEAAWPETAARIDARLRQWAGL